MSAHQRIDPLSRLVGTSAPPHPAPFSAPNTAASPAEDHDGGVPYPTTSTTAAREAKRPGHGVEAHDVPAGDLFSPMRDEAPKARVEESDGAPTTTGHARGRGRRGGVAGRMPEGDPPGTTGASTASTTTGSTDGSATAPSLDASAAAGATTTGTGAAKSPLEALVPAIDQARTFAERWEAPYRPEIFKVALGQLLTTVDAAPVAGGAPGIARSVGTSATGPAAGGATTRATANLAPTEKLARQLNVDVDAVDRALQFDDGKVIILARIDGKTRRELQIKYGLVLLYVKEIALATRLVDVEELRAVCVEHGCYDQGNFVGNFKKAQQDGFMREQPAEKGARVRRYMLTQKGMNEAAALLRELVLQ